MKRAVQAACLGWEEVEALTEDELERRLYGTPVLADSYTPPATGFTTVAEAVSSESGTGLWGVVTEVRSWSTSGEVRSGIVFVQGPVPAGGSPAPGSGIEVFLPESTTAPVTYGTVPALGDVVSVTNLTWSPFKRANQFLAGSTTVVSVIGTSPLPPPAVVDAAQVGSTSTPSASGYEDMRVTVEASLTAQGTSASGDCPPAVTDTVTSG